MPVCLDVIKNRDVQFLNKLPGVDDAEKASKLLEQVRGIESVKRVRRGRLRLRYDVRELTLQMIEDALSDVGFLLNNSLFCRFKRGLITYCEDSQRASLGVSRNVESAVLVHPDHTAQDPRPYNWRNYQ